MSGLVNAFTKGDIQSFAVGHQKIPSDASFAPFEVWFATSLFVTLH